MVTLESLLVNGVYRNQPIPKSSKVAYFASAARRGRLRPVEAAPFADGPGQWRQRRSPTRLILVDLA
jgi:hypothetical protein